METDDVSTPPLRARRAMATMSVATIVLLVAGIAYVHPSLSSPGAASAPNASRAQSGYTVDAVSFVDATTGWVAAAFDSGDFMILNTEDGGRHWSPQLSGPRGGHEMYLRFFDGFTGLFALVGARPRIYRTFDGGTNWTPSPALAARASALAYSFVNPADGWMLVRDDPQNTALRLYRTNDGGQSWQDLGPPVLSGDAPVGIHFSSTGAGWLDSLSAGPYAYRSNDFGSTWTRVDLPVPATDWPRPAQYVVEAQPTKGLGVVVTIATASTTTLWLGFPPEDGPPVKYTSALSSYVSTVLKGRDRLPDQVVLASEDDGGTWSAATVPAGTGAIGYIDAWDWWWVGTGTWSKSDDAGSTWNPLHGLGSFTPQPGTLQVLDARHAWFAATSSIPFLVATDDGGAHWRAVMLPPITTSRFTT